MKGKANLQIKGSSRTSFPILLVRWIQSPLELDELDRVQRLFKVDRAYRTVQAKSRSDVLKAIRLWLQSDNAQILYIGAHGTEEGLIPKKVNTRESLISWMDLLSVIEEAKEPIVLVLGACSSASVAESWSQ